MLGMGVGTFLGFGGWLGSLGRLMCCLLLGFWCIMGSMCYLPSIYIICILYDIITIHQFLKIPSYKHHHSYPPSLSHPLISLPSQQPNFINNLLQLPHFLQNPNSTLRHSFHKTITSRIQLYMFCLFLYIMGLWV